jgi:hypothetical protein
MENDDRGRSVILNRRVKVIPGYDRRHDDPVKDFGVHDCRIYFYVVGRQGAVVLEVGTNWYPDSVMKWWASRDMLPRMEHPIDGPLTIHSATPVKGSKKRRCAFRDDLPCWEFSSSHLHGQELTKVLRTQGSAALLAVMERIYGEKLSRRRRPRRKRGEA